jgi:hypothetical protein
MRDGDVRWLTGTVMPDHVHLLFQLGARLVLNRVVAKWRSYLSRASLNVDWQSNYFEHLLRPAETAESYAWYIFMNPYRERLVPLNEPWSGWWTDGSIAWEFLAHARPGPTPHPEWDEQFEERVRGLETGG